MAILAAGAVLIWLLTRAMVSVRLYLAAYALWLLTAGFFLISRAG
jgi:hypothetical protein